jgi:hypothetical protein
MKGMTIVLTGMFAAVCAQAQTGDPGPPANTNLHTAMLFTVGVDTKKAVPPVFVSADAPLLSCETNRTTLMLSYTNSVLNLKIASPGYEMKDLRLARTNNTMIVGLQPKKQEPHRDREPHR